MIDFYVASLKLGIEIDGMAHDMGDRPARDETRDQWIEAQGIRILRILSKEALTDPNAVADSIVRLCAER